MDDPLPCHSAAISDTPQSRLLAWLLLLCAPSASLFAADASLRELIPSPPLPHHDAGQASSLPEISRDVMPDSGPCSLTGHGQAGSPPYGCARPGDEIWYISARHREFLCEPDDLSRMRVWRHDSELNLPVESALDEFYAADDPAVITIFYVHGARVTEEGAFERTSEIYSALAAGIASDERIRFVLLSWPNPKTKRVPSDFWIAESLADRLGVAFGRVVAGIDPGVKISLITFSLGAQIADAGLQELVHLETSANSAARRVRVVHWSAAVDNTFLLPGRRHELAIHAVDRMLIFVNHRDPVNKRFHLMNAERPQSLGYVGMPLVGQLGDDAARISEYDATRSLGVSHGYSRNLESCDVLALTRAYVMWWNVDARLSVRAGGTPSH